METTPTTKQHGFTSKNGETTEEKVLMLITQTAEITLSAFAIKQLIAGAQIWLKNDSAKHIKHGITYDMFDMFTRLSFYIAQHAENKEAAKSMVLSVNRDDVLQLRYWLEARMLHCENERIAENTAIEQWNERFNHYMENTRRDEDEAREFAGTEPQRNFNPDSYITMKLLLIELREWLLGTTVPIEYNESRKPTRD